MKSGRIGAFVGAALLVSPSAGAGHAQQNFPDRPIRLIIPYSVGSVTDVFGRIVAQNMAEQWKGTILNESKSGGNGSIAAEEVARAAPDGYTWLLVTTFFTASPSLNVSLKWDPVRDFIPIGQICRAPNFFIVPTTLPVKTVAEYVALAKEKPGKLNYSHPGKGSTGHSVSNCSRSWPGSTCPASAIAAIRRWWRISRPGLITSTFLSANQALAQVQTGTIRIIGAINDGRSKYFPDVPTMAEQGFAEAQVTPWFGIVVPNGTPRADRRPHQQGARHRAGDRRTCSKSSIWRDARPRRRSRAEFAGSHQGRRRAMGQGGQGRRHSAGLRPESGRRPSLTPVPDGSPEGRFRRIKPHARSRFQTPCPLPPSSNGYGRFRFRSVN